MLRSVTGAVFFDVDGTLMTGRKFHDGVFRLFRDVAYMGVIVALCSARPVASMRRIVQRLDVVRYLSAFQGSIVLRRASDGWQPVADRGFSRDVVAEVSQALSSAPCELWVYDAEDWYLTRQSAWAVREASIVGLEPRSLSFLPPDAVIRKLVVVSEGLDPGIQATISGVAAEVGLTVSRSSSLYLELTSVECGGDKGFSDICADAHLDPDRTVAVGDEHNDCGLLLAAGMGYAFPPLSMYVHDMPGVVPLASSGAQGIRELRSLMMPTLETW